MSKGIFGAKRLHKVLGIVFSFIIIFFSLSGIILNHRYFFRNFDVKRKYLPDSYSYKNWNNNSIRGSLAFDSLSTLIYGSEGVFLFDNDTKLVRPLNAGIPISSENKDIYSLTKTDDGSIFAVSSYNIYRYCNGVWRNFEIKGTEGRFTNIISRGDSLIITSRDNVYVSVKPYTASKKITIKSIDDGKYRMTLFRFVWFLHSGEMFGIFGKLIVDFIAVLFILISLSGLVYTLVLGSLKRNKREKSDNLRKAKINIVVKSIKLHNRLGKGFIYVFLFTVITGGFLRPPLMLAIIKGKVPAVKFSHFDTPNTWKDKLRFVRYDDEFDDWIVYSSDGLMSLKTMDSKPIKIACSTPVSVMGINVMMKDGNEWLIGSFEGLYRWNRKTNRTVDFFSGKEVEAKKGLNPPSFENMITAVISGFDDIKYPVKYDLGLSGILDIDMPASLCDNASISLWNLALEVHSGRIFKPFIGKFQVLYIFTSSILIVVVLISGLRVYNRRYRKQKKNDNI